MPLVEDPDNPGTYFPGAPSDDYDEDALGSGLYLFSTTETTGVSFSWGGVDFTQDGPYYLQSVEGWSSPPDGSADDVRVSAGHGSLLTPMLRRARVVTLEGVCATRSARDQLFQFLGDSMAVAFGDGSGTSPLAGWVAGRVLTAEAQLQRFAATTEQVRWARGVFGFVVQWRCPDPLRYGAWQNFTATITGSSSSISFPVTPPWVFAAAPPSGQLVLHNDGNADAPASFALNGPLTAPGLDVGGSRVTFGFNLDVGDRLVIDSAAGAAFLNSAYRAPAARSALVSDLVLPPGDTTVQALGDVGVGGMPWVTAAFRPAYW